ncbi:hypothetical protein N431DRAFT_445360 [Stipitochalara longipes BDJ]|nr:hypothetical protein N431DRAFT_445360 [Stipitochalara longipes BDJ]
MASKNLHETGVREEDLQFIDESQHGADNHSESDAVINESDPDSNFQPASKLEGEFESMSAFKTQEERTFTCFPKLAPEIRIKIWKEACKVTRNVDLWVEIGWWLSNIDGTLPGYPHFFRSQSRPPAVLSVCRESRAEGLKFYTLDFGIKVEMFPGGGVSSTASRPSRVYFNWKYDRLCLMNPDDFEPYFDDKHDLASEVLNRYVEKGLRFLALNIWNRCWFPGCHVTWNMIPWGRKLEPVVLFSLPDLAGAINFVDIEVDDIVDKIHDSPHHGSNDQWRLSQLKNRLQSVEKELAARKESGRCNSDLQLRSCEAQVLPHKPRIKSDLVNDKRTMISNCIMSGAIA